MRIISVGTLKRFANANTVRLVAAVLYEAGVLLVKFIGFHRDYDQIDAQTVDQKTWR